MKNYVFLLLAAVFVLCAGSAVIGSHEIHKPENKIVLADCAHPVHFEAVNPLDGGVTLGYGANLNMDIEVSIIYRLPERLVSYIDLYKPKGELNSKSLQESYIVNFARSNC
jgi:hypothetical protein